MVLSRDRAALVASLPQDIAFLAQAGVSLDALLRIAAIAKRKEMPASEVLLARGVLQRRDFIDLLARHIGAKSEAVPCLFALNLPVEAAKSILNAPPAPVAIADGAVIPVNAHWATKLLRHHKATRGTTAPLLLTSVPELRLAWLNSASAAFVERAANDLSDRLPEMSARRRLTRAQMLIAMLLVAFVAGLLLMAPLLQSILPAIVLTVFYLGSVLLRALMIWRLDSIGQNNPEPAKREAPEDMPVYSILVALYQEAGQIPDLVDALDQLDWPADRREVFLICEADDPQTIGAIEAIDLPAGFFLVKCPPSLPRTKPKALNFALPLASGKYTVLYDAEDRPHPGQLREAHRKFICGDAQLACLQAPLVIHNGAQNWLSAMFALEYDTLFGGTLPVLESLGGPIPLGGTSNHFQTELLRKCGEWDAWNVTEDADLGVRFARLGYRCALLQLPTLEEAPTHFNIWLKQRTRWLKGWIQTIAVHSRHPARTHRDLGLRRSVLFHLVLTAIVLSALVHPVFLAGMAAGAWRFAAGHERTVLDVWFFAIAAFNLAAGYTTYGFFAAAVARKRGKSVSLRLLATLPFYWLLISLAGWRALGHFVVKPFHWEKTRHGLANSGASANMKRGLKRQPRL